MAPNQTGSPFVLFQFVIIFFIFYFLLIKPQKDKKKQHEAMIGGLKKNDDVVTAGGVHGTIVNVKDTTVVLRVDDSVKIEVDKEAVSTLKKK